MMKSSLVVLQGQIDRAARRQTPKHYLRPPSGSGFRYEKIQRNVKQFLERDHLGL